MSLSPKTSAGVHRRAFLGALGGFACVAVTGASAEEARAATVTLPKPGERDVCPVCGMFVAKYPYWIATIRFRDGHLEHFDGAKDLWKYLLDMSRWARGRTREQIETIGVTSYYDGEMIDATTAVYVVGSDVYGPMGHELVPHPVEADAKEFITDHKGKRALRVDGITLALLANLDDGKFE
jgi:nitrous oxide reductase accessory protein NosL